MWTDEQGGSWGPSRPVAGLAIVVAAVVGLLGAGSDAPGRLLAAIAVSGLLGAAGWVLLGGPALQADPDGVRVRGLLSSRAHPWDQVQAIRHGDRRRGRAVELEVDGVLVAVPAALLGGASAASVAHELRLVRAHALRADADRRGS